MTDEPDVSHPTEPGAQPAAAPPGPPGPPETELRTFLIADIRGYTNYTEEHGDEAAAALAGSFAALVREVVEHRQGFLLELRGDEALAVFTSARQALKAANEIQRRQEIDALPRGIGIGLDAGEAIPIEGGFRGSALNLAARLCSQAGPGQVVASEAVIHLAARVDGLAYIDARTMRLKGLDEPVRAVTVVPEGRAPKRRRSPGGPSKPGRRGLLAIAGVALAAVVIGAVALGSGIIGGPSASPLPSGADASPDAETPTPSLVPGAGAIASGDLPLLAFLDPETGEIGDTLRNVGNPVDAIYADGAFWVLDQAPRSIRRIDATTHQDTLQIPIGFEIGAGTVGGGRVWVSETVDGVVHEFDAVSGRELRTITVWDSAFYNTVHGLAYGGDGVLWASGRWPGEVARIDLDTGVLAESIPVEADGPLDFADGSVWVIAFNDAALRIDPTTNEVVGESEILGVTGHLEVGGDYAWVAVPAEGSVKRIDEAFQTRSFPTGDGAEFVSFDESTGLLWVGNYAEGSVSRIDAVTEELKTFTVGHAVQPVAAGGGQVLVGVVKGPTDLVAELKGSVLRMASGVDFAENDPAMGWPADERDQLAQATCVRLLDYPEAAGAGGSTLQPSVAAAMPEISDDGRTYTFKVRPGFAFSPPSNEPITAETYRYSIERALSPGLGSDDIAFGYRFLPDIRGATAFHGGQAEHIEGIRAEGDTLVIDLLQPSGSFLRRLSLPTFCPVPIGTPAVQGGINDPPIARSGPYYIARHIPYSILILERNPNYAGPREATFDAIAWRTEGNLGRAVGQVERGELDWTASGGRELDAGGRIDQEWGEASPAAAAGDQRLFRPPLSGADLLVVNPASEALADVDVRRAVGLAIDRTIPGRFLGRPNDEVLPLPMPGIVLGDRYPLDGARPEEAKALLGGRSVSIRIAWWNCRNWPECSTMEESLRRGFEAAGIDATFVETDDPIVFARGLDSGFDLTITYAYLPYLDPTEWLGLLFEDFYPDEWVPADYAAELRRIEDLPAAEQDAASGALADRIANDAMVIPLSVEAAPQFVSDRLGCLTFSDPYPYLDIVSACLDQ